MRLIIHLTVRSVTGLCLSVPRRVWDSCTGLHSSQRPRQVTLISTFSQEEDVIRRKEKTCRLRFLWTFLVFGLVLLPFTNMLYSNYSFQVYIGTPSHFFLFWRWQHTCNETRINILLMTMYVKWPIRSNEPTDNNHSPSSPSALGSIVASFSSLFLTCGPHLFCFGARWQPQAAVFSPTAQ